MTFLTTDSPILLLAQHAYSEKAGIILKGCISLPPSQKDKVDSVVYYLSPFENFNNNITPYFKSLGEPVLMVITDLGNRTPLYVKGIVRYKDGTTAETCTCPIDPDKILTISGYMNPKKVFTDDDGRSYTISIADSFVPGSDDILRTFEESKKYCSLYNQGGFTDWRMPNLQEIEALYPLHALGISSIGNYTYWVDFTDQVHTRVNAGALLTTQRAVVKDIRKGEVTLIEKTKTALVRPIRRNYLEIIEEPNEQLAMQGTPCEDCCECDDLVKDYFESLEDHGPIVIEELFRIAAMLSEKEDVTFIDKLAAENLHALAMVLDEGYSIIPKIDIK